MSSNLKISVIIPVYNAERYIEQAILSVVNQPQVTEIVVVDDCSKDQSASIIAQLQTKYPIIRLIKSHEKHNVGAGAVRNIGIRAASNDWIGFLDVDDYYYPNRFEQAFRVIEQNPDADGVYEAVENIFENEAAKHVYLASRPDKSNHLYTLELTLKPEELFKVLMAGDQGFFHLNGVLIRKQSFEKIGYFNKELELSQDTDALFKIAMTDRLYPGSITKPVAARLVHDTNRMFSNDDKLNFFRTKKYYDFIEYANVHKLSPTVKSIIEEKNIKLCASDLLGWNIYKRYRIKHFILKLTYRVIIERYLRREEKKYLL
jgi:glycosyltransferase involved in cell wall biosynthesis